MLNWVFLVLVAGSVLCAAFTGHMADVSDAGLKAAKTAVVDVVVPLIGQMALWLGFMRVLQEAGLMRSIARGLRPVMRRLFPDVPAEHPAMGAMIMNFASNIAGLGNAATPFGLKAMRELDKLNRRPGVATDSMALFLAVNTSGPAVLPLGVVGIRAALGSSDAGGIIVPTLIATMLSTVVAVVAIKLTQRLRVFSADRHPVMERDGEAAGDTAALEKAEEIAVERAPATGVRAAINWAVAVAMLVAVGLFVRESMTDPLQSGFDVTRVLLSSWLLPVLMLSIVMFGFGRKVKVYEAFIAGAKEGFNVAVMIIPYVVAIIVAFRMFEASGALGALVSLVGPATGAVGVPAEVLPMAFIRPFSGSGAMSVMTAIMTQHGPDSLVGRIVSVMNGSTETTFYVLAVYFGAAQVRVARHTVIACLAADVVGLVGAVYLTQLFFG